MSTEEITNQLPTPAYSSLLTEAVVSLVHQIFLTHLKVLQRLPCQFNQSLCNHLHNILSAVPLHLSDDIASYFLL